MLLPFVFCIVKMSWGGNNQFSGKVKYVPKKTTEKKNQASKYANSLMKSQIAMVNSNLNNDYEKIMKGGCIYLQNFFCETSELEMFENLKKEINLNEIVNWSKHFKIEDPNISETFNQIVEKMAKHFNVKVKKNKTKRFFIFFIINSSF